MQRLLIIFILLSISYFSFSQNNKSDSIESSILRSKEDTNKVNLLLNLAIQLKNNDPQKALLLSKQGLALAKREEYKKGIAMGHSALAQVQYNLGEYQNALGNYSESIKTIEEMLANSLNDNELKKMLSKNYSGIGNIHYFRGEYEQALKYFIDCLKIYEGINDTAGIAGASLGLGNVYNSQKEYEKALGYYFRALTMRQAVANNDARNKQAMAGIYTNVSGIYTNKKNFGMAIENAQKAVTLFQETNDLNGLSIVYGNIASIYSDQHDSKSALEYYQKSLKLKLNLGDKYGIAATYINIGSVLSDNNKFQQAIEYFNNAMLYADSVGAKDLRKEVYKYLSITNAAMNKYKEAFTYLNLMSALNDTLLNEESTRQIAELQTVYETNKKQAEIENLKKEGMIADLELDKQKNARNFSIIGGALILILSLVIYSRYRVKQKANVLLSEQNAIIQKKNKDITDSINYAKRIQQAILPDMESLKSKLPDFFLLYLPKDIVSGDFYFYVERNNKIIVSAVDCTGHGVPGAFMSMIGSDQLNYIIIEKGITQPAEILSELNKGIKKALKQTEVDSESRDGMDIALCSIDTNRKILEFAGAHRPLYYISSGKLNEIKSDKVAIGGTTEENHQFKNYEVNYKPGDLFYIFSDGYHDQFGGTDKRKFMTKRFKELLFSISNKSMAEQKEILKNTIEQWRGNLHQLDDILVIGLKF